MEVSPKVYKFLKILKFPMVTLDDWKLWRLYAGSAEAFFLLSPKEANVYGAVCLKPGLGKRGYANLLHRLGYGERGMMGIDYILEDLVKMGLLWVEIIEGYETEKGWRYYKRFYPSDQYLREKLGKDEQKVLLKALNETLREALEKVGYPSQKHPITIIECRSKSEINRVTSNIIACTKVSSIALCGDLDGYKFFVRPYESILDHGGSVYVAYTEDNKEVHRRADELRDLAGVDVVSIRKPPKTVEEITGEAILKRISYYPWISRKVGVYEEGVSPRFNIYNGTVLVPMWPHNYKPMVDEEKKYPLMVIKYPILTEKLYTKFKSIFPQLNYELV
jgi:hypothetical protein